MCLTQPVQKTCPQVAETKSLCSCRQIRHSARHPNKGWWLLTILHTGHFMERAFLLGLAKKFWAKLGPDRPIGNGRDLPD